MQLDLPCPTWDRSALGVIVIKAIHLYPVKLTLLKGSSSSSKLTSIISSSLIAFFTGSAVCKSFGALACLLRIQTKVSEYCQIVEFIHLIIFYTTLASTAKSDVKPYKRDAQISNGKYNITLAALVIDTSLHC